MPQNASKDPQHWGGAARRHRILWGVITDNYGNGHLVRIQILIVPTIGRNLLSVKTATMNDFVSIFDRENPRLEAFGVTLPLRGEQDDLYSFMLDLWRHRAGDERGVQQPALAPAAGLPQQKELSTHAEARRQRYHLRRHHSGLGRLRRGERPTTSSSKKAQSAGITVPFQLCYGDLMGPFTPEAYGGFKYFSKITNHFTKWTAVYLLKNKSCAIDFFGVTSTVITCGGRVIRWRADK